MPPPRKLAADTIGSAGRDGEQGAALLGVRVARTLYGRWRLMSAADRAPLGSLAAEVKERALDLRGATDLEVAGRDLEQASERLAAAMVESAELDPQITDVEVTQLRADLARELDRLASGEIRASRGTAARRR